MPVQIGAKSHSFSNPTGLLADCHRRIEMFLGSLEKVGTLLSRTLSQDEQHALETALRYFREAAPKHNADEEESLFPRLRALPDPEVRSALEMVDRLEQDHRRAAPLHAEVERLGEKLLAESSMTEREANQFRAAVAQLLGIYREHIRLEDEVVFPLAKRILSPPEQAEIAHEMAARRQS